MTGRIYWADTNLAALPAFSRGRFRATRMELRVPGLPPFRTALRPRQCRHRRAGSTPPTPRDWLRSAAVAELARLGLGDPDRDVATFAGGERQRVAIACALAARPAILLADEPTAALHREAADALVANPTRDAHTLVVVSHDPRLLAAMDHVVTREDGRIVADGSR